MPDEEPNHRLFAIRVVFQGHYPGHHLGLASNTKAAEEEGHDPQRYTEHQARRKNVHQIDVRVACAHGGQNVVKATQASNFAEGDNAQDGGAHDHDGGLGSIGPNRRPDAPCVAVGDNQHKADENTGYLRPTKHGVQGDAAGGELRCSVDGEEEHRKNGRQLSLRCAGFAGHQRGQRTQVSLVPLFLDVLVQPYPSHQLTDGGDPCNPNR